MMIQRQQSRFTDFDIDLLAHLTLLMVKFEQKGNILKRYQEIISQSII